MEPMIYKPGAYKTPGVYKGAGGIYNGRGVYNDGAGGSSPIPNNLVFCEYFEKCVGEQKTSGTISEFLFDSSCPLIISGGAPTASANKITQLKWNTDKVKEVALSGNYTFECFAKVERWANNYYSAPLLGFCLENDNWKVVPALYVTSPNNSKINMFANSYQMTTLSVVDENWHHYEVCSDNGRISVFLDGVKFNTSWPVTPERLIFELFTVYDGRTYCKYSQVALWDNVKHTSNFTVDYNPICY